MGSDAGSLLPDSSLLARGVLPREEGDEPSEVIIRRLRGGRGRLFIWNYGHAYAAIANDADEARRLIQEKYNVPDDVLEVEPEVVETPVAFCVVHGFWTLDKGEYS